MRVRATTFGLLSLVVLPVLAGCGGDSDTPSTAPTTTTTPSTSATTNLDGKTYVSTAVTGHKLVRNTRVTLTFQDDDLSLNAGCNTLGGGYQLDGDQLVTEQLGGTEMGCDNPRHEQDQ